VGGVVAGEAEAGRPREQERRGQGDELLPPRPFGGFAQALQQAGRRRVHDPHPPAGPQNTWMPCKRTPRPKPKDAPPPALPERTPGRFGRLGKLAGRSALGGRRTAAEVPPSFSGERGVLRSAAHRFGGVGRRNCSTCSWRYCS